MFNIAVIGAGIMGRSIAAYIASCDYPVLLLDVPDSKSNDRNLIVKKALRNILDQSLISHPSKLQNIKIGNLEDDINLLNNYELVIEAIVENLNIKLDLFDKLAKFLSPNCIIASNTSTLSLSSLKSRKAWAQTLVLHFFNPVRHLSLLELIADQGTSDRQIKKIEDFLVHKLGREVVRCNDSPGFIANRVGCFFLESALQKAIYSKLDLYKIDLFANKFLGLPKTGIFGLYDLIGLDVMSLIGKSLTAALPLNDEYQGVYFKEGLVNDLISQGSLGVKSGKGFYLKNSQGKLILDLSSRKYLPLNRDMDEINDFKELPNIYLEYFKDLVQQTYSYALKLVPEVVNDISLVDKVLKIGFNWKFGISGMAEKLDIIASKTNKFHQVNKQDFILQNSDANISYHKDKLVFTLTSESGIITENLLIILNKAIDIAEKQNNVLILRSGKHFSKGADLNFFLENAQNKNWKKIEEFLKLGQSVMQRLKRVNSISIAQNYALGGGCELLLHSKMVITGLELQAGLVETNLGLIPGWGGLKEMYLRSKGDKNKLIKLLSNIIFAKKTASADYLKEDYLVDIVKVINPEYRLEEALELDFQDIQTNDFIPIQKPINLINEISNTDPFKELIINKINHLINSASNVDDLLKGEREIFLELIKNPNTLLKINKILL